MTTTATHRDATSLASTQASLIEYLDASANDGEDTDEPTIDPSVNLDRRVCTGKEGSRYHAIRTIEDGTVVSMCPHHQYRGTITLREAVALELDPCNVCNPIDWRAEPEAQP